MDIEQKYKNKMNISTKSNSEIINADWYVTITSKINTKASDVNVPDNKKAKGSYPNCCNNESHSSKCHSLWIPQRFDNNDRR